MDATCDCLICSFRRLVARLVVHPRPVSQVPDAESGIQGEASPDMLNSPYDGLGA